MLFRLAVAACSVVLVTALTATGQPRALAAVKEKDVRDVVGRYLKETQAQSDLKAKYGAEGLVFDAANVDFDPAGPAITWYVPTSKTIDTPRAIVVKQELADLLRTLLNAENPNKSGILSPADLQRVTVRVEFNARPAAAQPQTSDRPPEPLPMAGFVSGYWAPWYGPYPLGYYTWRVYYPGWAGYGWGWGGCWCGGPAGYPVVPPGYWWYAYYPWYYPYPAYPYWTATPYAAAPAGGAPSPTAVASAAGGPLATTARAAFAPADAAAVEELTRGKGAADALALYDRGHRLFCREQPAEALVYLTAATALNGRDARFWYFRWLAERALGAEAEADESLRTAVRLDREASAAEQAEIRRALEPVQGPIRGVLEAARAGR